MAADFFVGESGDVLSVTMPFDASVDGQTVAVRVRKPPMTTWITWTGATATATHTNVTIGAGALDTAGTYDGEVIATRPSPARVRVVRFKLTVG